MLLSTLFMGALALVVGLSPHYQQHAPPNSLSLFFFCRHMMGISSIMGAMNIIVTLF
jgi:heme/copper-type cytochrome/quinol oxidase subunit 1